MFPDEEEVRRALGIRTVSDRTMSAVLGGDHWELWQGLPEEYEFEPAKNRGNQETLVARHKDPKNGQRFYIWVLPETCRAIEQNPRALLLALASRRTRSLQVALVVPADPTKTLPENIQHVRALNTEIIKGISTKAF